jgi:membrane protease YdiL (CAAX protease family)
MSVNPGFQGQVLLAFISFPNNRKEIKKIERRGYSRTHMEERIKIYSVNAWEPWFILVAFLSLFVLCLVTSVFMSIVLEGTNLLLSLEEFDRREVLLANLLLVLYCLKQYGPIKWTEFIPRGKDYAVLAIGLLIIFWAFGLIVGREGIKADPDWQILTGYQYGFIVLALTLFGPLLEEVFLRRYFYEMLATLYSRMAALAVTVCIGTLLHWHPDITWFNIFWHFFLAGVFTLAYMNSRLSVSVLLHIFNNTMAMLLAR